MCMGRKNRRSRTHKTPFNLKLNQRKGDKLMSLFEQIEGKKRNDKNTALQTAAEKYEKNMVIQPITKKKDEKILNTKAIEEQAKIKIAPGYFIENDSIGKKISNSIEIVFEFSNLMEHVEEYLQYVTEKISEADRKRVDLEHNIELKGGNCYQMFCISKVLQQVLIERRDYKDLESILQSISQFATTHSSVLGEIKSLSDKLERISKLQDNRIYYPRSELQLPVSEDYRNLPPEAQDIIKRNYENRK